MDTLWAHVGAIGCVGLTLSLFLYFDRQCMSIIANALMYTWKTKH